MNQLVLFCHTLLPWINDPKIFWSLSPRKGISEAGSRENKNEHITKSIHCKSHTEARTLEMVLCKFCGTEIDFIKLQSGKWLPVDRYGEKWHKCKEYYRK